MRLLAWSTNLTADTASRRGAELVGKRERLEHSDIVTVHLKLSDRGRGLIGADELRALGPNGYLVNTSRGPIVEEDALVAALYGGTIAGAGLDVFDTEPLPLDHPLRTAPNAVLTPHIGFVARQSYRKIYDDAVEDVTAWLDGKPIRELRQRYVAVPSVTGGRSGLAVAGGVWACPENERNPLRPDIRPVQFALVAARSGPCCRSAGE